MFFEKHCRLFNLKTKTYFTYESKNLSTYLRCKDKAY